MINNKKILGLVIARGGSKGLPVKICLNSAANPSLQGLLRRGLKADMSMMLSYPPTTGISPQRLRNTAVRFPFCALRHWLQIRLKA